MVSGVRRHEVLKVGDAGSELVLRHGERLFSGEGKALGESEKLVKSGRSGENERCRIQYDVV